MVTPRRKRSHYVSLIFSSVQYVGPFNVVLLLARLFAKSRIYKNIQKEVLLFFFLRILPTQVISTNGVQYLHE